MKRKGFTLVELLAVIAILAILVIIALPNVLKMYSDGKKNIFTTEVKQIYSVSRQQWMLDSINNPVEKTYSKCSNCNESKNLNLNGGKDISYYVKLDNYGNVKELYVTNGVYQFQYSGNSIESYFNNIDNISELESNEIISIDQEGVKKGGSLINGVSSPASEYIYVISDITFNIGGIIPGGVTIYDNYEEAINAFGHPIFIRHKIENNVIRESFLGFVKNGNVYYLKGGDSSSFENNKSIVDGVFENCNFEPAGYGCVASGISILIDDVGNVHASSNSICDVNDEGASACQVW